MNEFFLLCTWLIFLYISYKRSKNNKTWAIDPSFLFFGVQAVSLLLFIVLDATDSIIPSYKFNYLSVSYILFLGLAFFIGSEFMRRSTGLYRTIYRPSHLQKNIFFKISFFSCFAIGIIGTFLLIKNMGFNGGLVDIFLKFYLNINEFNENFFSSSAAILWQANFATLFWSNFVKNSWVKTIIIIVSIFDILLRGAYVYLVIGLFYLITPMILRDGFNKKLILFVVFFGILLNLITLLSYNWEGDPLLTYAKKIYPYTAGNFVNLAYNTNTRLSTNIAELMPWNDVMANLGFSTIMIYIDKYLSLNTLSTTNYLPFLLQSENLKIYGNTCTIYGNLVFVPFIFGFSFMFFLGMFIRLVYKHAHKNLFFMSIYSWLSAASFLSFATGGHFITTRFFPALIYIWPFLFIWLFYRIIKDRYALQ